MTRYVSEGQLRGLYENSHPLSFSSFFSFSKHEFNFSLVSPFSKRKRKNKEERKNKHKREIQIRTKPTQNCYVSFFFFTSERHSCSSFQF